MLLRDRFALTLQALGALRDQRAENRTHPGGLRIARRGAAFLRYVRGAQLIRFDTARSRSRPQRGIQAVTAPVVVLLGNHTEVAHGAIDAALQRMKGDERIGAVGGKVVGPDGGVRDAGGIIRRDGTLSPYLRGAAALAPEANFVREVDFCSGACLAVRTPCCGRWTASTRRSAAPTTPRPIFACACHGRISRGLRPGRDAPQYG